MAYVAGAGSDPRSCSCSWELGSGLHLERSCVPPRGWGRHFGTPLGALGAVVRAAHSLGLQIDLMEAADTVLICTDGFNSSCSPWQEGLYPPSAVPQQVPMVLSKTPVLRFSVITGLPETRESSVCVHTGSISSSLSSHKAKEQLLPSSLLPQDCEISFPLAQWSSEQGTEGLCLYRVLLFTMALNKYSAKAFLQCEFVFLSALLSCCCAYICWGAAEAADQLGVTCPGLWSAGRKL